MRDLADRNAGSDKATDANPPALPFALTLIRGLPGSGKTTMARALATQNRAIHLEADQFMTGPDGQYRFDARHLGQAHQSCQDACEGALARGDRVIIANTFCEIWEMQPYLDMAKRHGCALQIIECHADFGTIHNVPAATMAAMRKRWQSLPATKSGT